MFALCLHYVLMKSEWGGRLTTEEKSVKFGEIWMNSDEK